MTLIHRRPGRPRLLLPGEEARCRALRQTRSSRRIRAEAVDGLAGSRRMSRRWLIPFGIEQGHRKIAHLVRDPEQWLASRLCSGKIINTRLAHVLADGRRGVTRCAGCRRAAEQLA